MVIGATYFHRDLHTMKKLLMPVREILESEGKVRIWSAGCSDGSEPFTIAILISEEFEGIIPDSVEILATDVDPDDAFEKFFETGIYKRERLTRIPDKIRKRYFHEDDKSSENLILNDSLRKKVKFMRHDLLSGISPGGVFDIIICKNVLLHFNDAEQSAITGLFYDTLNNGGYLVTEQTHRLSDKDQNSFARIFPDARIYQKIS
ncbi:CheR family methyltransferase [Methanoplanus limicola]|uniref:MCP methyltransferase, CheR-type n=1 Tax=Methanoplanus limicola DSM 2279 TaxID=937775 RepID=H1Z3C2_9EURY|nr:CheR family methyltransferase [Methanoplanus limicola]EHQ36537.1 MCP methyltransferase, CheR-type [Methanoplanus limicola DSM 2279]